MSNHLKFSPPPGYGERQGYVAAREQPVIQSNTATDAQDEHREQIVLSRSESHTPGYVECEESSWSSQNGMLASGFGQSDTRPVTTESPPGYRPAIKPTTPILYTFLPQSSNFMALMPPASAQDSRPQYCVTVSFNCFNPSFFITTVTRGENRNYEFVGELEMKAGEGTKLGTIAFRGQTVWIESVFTTGSRYHKLRWSFGKRALVWDCSKATVVCTSNDQKVVYAKFTPAVRVKTRKPAVLEVFPEGQGLLDHIIMSLLIEQRFSWSER